jgi:hypothetical protein
MIFIVIAADTDHPASKLCANNVWSNPELTCQHVDQQIPLAPAATRAMETKILVFQGSLDDVLQRLNAQRQTLE